MKKRQPQNNLLQVSHHTCRLLVLLATKILQVPMAKQLQKGFGRRDAPSPWVQARRKPLMAAL